jgi:hypothetical protein
LKEEKTEIGIQDKSFDEQQVITEEDCKQEGRCLCFWQWLIIVVFLYSRVLVFYSQHSGKDVEIRRETSKDK